jgi:putative Mg2+ transporter-C (MgtC) family protein
MPHNGQGGCLISDLDIIIRLLLAAVMGAVVGYERERQHQPAGLRTHIILVVGSALAMTISINLAIQFRSLAPNGDPARLAAQVISGIGFLGAGAILRFGFSIKGLTTAASLWTMAIVGLAVGAGHYLPAAATTALLLVSLVLVTMVEHRFIQSYTTQALLILADDRQGFVEDVLGLLKKHLIQTAILSIEKQTRHQRIKLELELRIKENYPLEPLLEELAGIAGVRSCKISGLGSG